MFYITSHSGKQEAKPLKYEPQVNTKSYIKFGNLEKSPFQIAVGDR